ncbi:MAG: CPBP family intramembrane metalloprotease [Actinobacteria bacterium]|nr:MAG: CPBP family intramembrane metalloprotease [Actinomycetota bacterium]
MDAPEPSDPGWHPDPFGRLRFRWWDGTRWTAYAANSTAVQWDAAPVEPPVPRETGLPGLGLALAGYVVGVALAFGVAAVLWATGHPGGRTVGLAATEIGLWAGLLGACFYVSRRRGTGSLARDFGWRVRPVDLGFGLAGSLAARAASGVVVSPIPTPFHHVRAPDRSVFARVAHGRAGWAVLVVVVCVGAPLVEELFFRGLLQTRLVDVAGPVGGIVITSVLFGAAHLLAWQGWLTLVYALAVAGGGLVLGTLRYYTRRLGTSTLAHAFFNAQAVIAVALLR